MTRLLLALAILFVGPLLAQALSTQEIDALNSILLVWPRLQTAVPAWNASSIVNACEEPIYGIYCSPGPDPHVTGLSMSDINLQGSIPPALINLTYLQSLSLESCSVGGLVDVVALSSPALVSISLTNNHLAGQLSDSFFTKPTLEYINLNEFALTGHIPREIAQATKLRSLSVVSFRNPFGQLPEELGSLKYLEELVVTAPLMTSPIPRSIGNATSLTRLELQILIRSDIPPSIGQLVNLKTLYLTQDVTGVLPEEIGNLESLEVLRITNSFSLLGTVPASIGNLKKLQTLDLSSTAIRGPLPPTIGDLENLKKFGADSLYMVGNRPEQGLRQLPAEIGKLKNLSYWTSIGSGLNGTLPAEMENMKSLTTLQLSQNQLTGTLPRLHQPFLALRIAYNQMTGPLDPLIGIEWPVNSVLDLSHNQFSGSLPAAFFDSVPTTLNLNNNNLTGDLPDHAFSTTTYVDMSHNEFSGALPSSHSLTETTLAQLRLSFNKFTGPVPAIYTKLNFLKELSLNNNRFTGALEGWGAAAPSGWTFSPISVNLAYNQLSGELTDLSNFTSLQALDLSHNHLSGTIPDLPVGIKSLDLSRNYKISGNLFPLSSYPLLTSLDVSWNSFRGNIPPSLLVGPISVLNLAHNQLTGTFASFSISDSNLTVLDISYNHLSTMVEPKQWTMPNLISFSASSNRLDGNIPIIAPRLSVLDISNNQFSFPLLQLQKFPQLLTLDASKNRLTGSPSDLSGLLELRLADVSENQFVTSVNLKTLNTLYNGKLRQLYMDRNYFLSPITAPIGDYGGSYGPWRTLQSQPSPNKAAVDCYTLTFQRSDPGLIFIFDEDAFDYQQCDCRTGYFGMPPYYCYQCPPAADCKGRYLSFGSDTYGYTIPIPTNWKTTWHFPLQPVIQTESCLVSLSADTSNCIGLKVQMDVRETPPELAQSFHELSPSQCAEGSGGRLCTQCQCDLSKEFDSSDTSHSGNDTSSTHGCYHKNGFLCKKCPRTFKTSQSLPVLIAVIIVLLLVLSVVMALILRSHRQVRDKKWGDLSRMRRIWSRLIDSTKFGFISILVLFLQVLGALTRWDTLVLRTLSAILNGKTEQLGLVCFFPALISDPMLSLLLQLFLPIMVATLMACSVGIAELVLRLIEFRKTRAKMRKTLDWHHGNNIETIGLITHDEDMDARRSHTEYPAHALIASNTLAVFQFFYFGTSLSATEYFFPDIQAHTGRKYVQAHPWMLYADASRLRAVSIPWLIVIVMGLPLWFVVFAWQVRHKVSSPTIKNYVGSLFARYRPRLFWWEAVNLVKKLSIALLIRGISPSNPLQAILISLAISVPMLVQVALRPWKRYAENVLDPIGSVLLVLSLSAASVSKRNITVPVVLSLDAAFALTLIGLIIYHFFKEKTEYQVLWEAAAGGDNFRSSGLQIMPFSDSELTNDSKHRLNDLDAEDDDEEPDLSPQ